MKVLYEGLLACWYIGKKNARGERNKGVQFKIGPYREEGHNLDDPFWIFQGVEIIPNSGLTKGAKGYPTAVLVVEGRLIDLGDTAQIDPIGEVES